MVLITSIQATCFTLIKVGLDFSPPLLFAGLRAAIGGSALIGLAAAQRRTVFPPRRTWTVTLFLALVATSLTFAAMFLSPGRTQAGIASALGNLQPFLTLMLAHWLLHEDLGTGKAIATALGLLGVAMLTYPSLSGGGALGISGALLAFSVSGGATISNLTVKRLDVGESLLAITGWQLVLGGAVLLAVSPAVENAADVQVTLGFLALLLFLSLAGTAFVFAVWFAFIQEGEVGQLATFFFLVPVFGLAIATVVFGESVGYLTVAGVGVLLAAVAVMAVQKASPAV